MKQRIQFSTPESLGTVALRGAIGGKGSHVVPTFGTTCVCCNADADGRMQDYILADNTLEAPPLPVPVCRACKDHAFRVSLTAAQTFVALGVFLTGAGIFYATKRPLDRMLEISIVGGLVLAAIGAVWMRATSRRINQARSAGHHPLMSFGIRAGTWLDTTNDKLAEDLLALNPGAHRVTPLLWRRQQARDFPSARAVHRDDPPPPE